MTLDEYLAKIQEILDGASGDSELSKEDYIALCSDVATEAQDRADAAEADVEEEEDK